MKLKLTISSFLMIGFLCFTLVSCNSTEGQSIASKNNNIPELLQRNEKIQLGKEWDDVQNAYSSFSQAIKKDDSDHITKIKLAQLYIREARVTGEHGHYYPAALKVLEEILNTPNLTNETKFLALMTKSGVQLSLHDFADAKVTGTEAVLLNPANAQIHGVLVDANVELGNYELAVELLDRMVQIKPDIRSYSRVAYLREIHGDYKGSVDAISMAIKAGYPGTEETAWAMQTLGDMYVNYAEYDKAEKIYNEIVQLRPNYPFAVGALGDLYLKQGDLKKAESKLNEAIDIIPEVGFYISMAELYKKEKRTEEFNKTIDDILVMLKEDTDSGHNMNLEYADLYLSLLEDNDKALEYAKLEYDKRPENIDVNKMMAEIYLVKGDKDKAAEYFKVAIKTGSKDPKLTDIKAMM